MKLRTRILSLLGISLSGFLIVLAVLHALQHRSVDSVLDAVGREKRQLLGRVVTLQGATLRQFSRDYTQWDEMCGFLEHPTAEWAQVNIAASLESWKFHAVWVFGSDGAPVYSASRTPDPDLPRLPFAPGTVAEVLASDAFRHFHLLHPRGVLELRTAPIQPSDDTARTTRPRGWFVVAKLWDDAQLRDLSEIAGGDVEWSDRLPGRPELAEDRVGGRVAVRVPLAGWDGAPVRTLYLSATPPLAGIVYDTDQEEVVLFVACGAAALLGLGWSLRRWVLRPLEQISEGVATDSAEPLAALLKSDDEFGHVAELFVRSLKRKQELQSEIADRRRAEEALRAALEARARLGRDLHDRTIQSIYAAGLNLEAAHAQWDHDPAGARRRLGDGVRSLNEVIAELRAVIAGTTDPAQEPAALHTELQRIAARFGDGQPEQFRFEVPEDAAERLSLDERTELVAIAREAASNALRHSRCRVIVMRLRETAGERVFEVRDDGCGFDPANVAARGHGLENMTRRAEEIGASLEIDSAAGRGTTVRVELPARTGSTG